jgi:hypothetical protein
MRIGTFTEAVSSLGAHYRKTMKSRTTIICLWVQAALIIAFLCTGLIIGASVAYTIRSHQPVPGSLDWRVWYWSFVSGLPATALILGLGGFLPGTGKRNETGQPGEIGRS